MAIGTDSSFLLQLAMQSLTRWYTHRQEDGWVIFLLQLAMQLHCYIGSSHLSLAKV